MDRGIGGGQPYGLSATIFPMAETSQGVSGYASSHDVFFRVLEDMPIVLAVGIWGVVVPGIAVVEERVRGDEDVGNERIEDSVVGKECGEVSREW